MSVRDLADTAGVSTKTVVQLEYARQRPSYRSMRAISDALGVPAGEIAEFAAALEERGKDAA
jgi:transcriptional regulator with XRE-family HTH domain